jgi:hypothetical protein
MAGLARKLFVNWHNKTLQLSDASATPVDPPIFQKYETVPLCVAIVQPCDPWGPNNFERLDVTNISLKVAINDTLDDATPLAEQATFTKNTNDNTFEGNLILNTAGFNTWIGSSATKEAYLEIEATEGVAPRTKIYSKAITVKGSVLQPTTTSPDPTREYYTKGEMDGLFVQFRLQPGQTISIPNPANTHERVLGCTDDPNELDVILPI